MCQARDAQSKVVEMCYACVSAKNVICQLGLFLKGFASTPHAFKQNMCLYCGLFKSNMCACKAGRLGIAWQQHNPELFSDASRTTLPHTPVPLSRHLSCC